MEKRNGVNHSLLIATKSRRKGVIERLTTQLKTGTKQTKTAGIISLSDTDRIRIQKEIDVLKTRI